MPVPRIRLDNGPILLIGDLHGDIHSAFEPLAHGGAAGARTVIFLGDFCIPRYTPGVHGSEVGSQRRAKKLRLVAEAAGIQMIYAITGNHDSFDLIDRLPEDADGCRLLSKTMRILPPTALLEHEGLVYAVAASVR